MSKFRGLIFLFVVFSLALPLQSKIFKITINAPIHPVTSEYIQEAIDQADRENASLLLITINTPGGLDTSMREIIEKILGSKTPVAAYISPNGARAASAGFFICLACDVFAMAPGTSTGAAHPVGVSMTGQQMDETMAEKVTEDAAAYIRTIAEKRNRNIQMAEAAVKLSRSYTESEALKGELIDLVASTEDEIIKFLNNKKIKRFTGEEIQLHLEDETVVEIPMTTRQKFLLTISNPNLAYILLMLGLLGLYFEFSNPGAILPGVMGGICLLLAIFAFQILPINYVGLLLILLAIGLFILEIKVQSYGILSIGGIMAMILGSIMLIDSPIPELRPSLNFIIPVAIGLSLIFIFLITLVVRVHSRRAVTGKEGLIGKIGIAQTDLTPEGKVFVHGELWKAEAEENVPKGSKVRVIKILDGLRIKVSKV